MNDVTRVLSAIEAGDPQAAEHGAQPSLSHAVHLSALPVFDRASRG